MAIRIRRKFFTNAEMKKKIQLCHDALKGSPGYAGNEIALCEDDETSFYLVVGNDNGEDLNIELDHTTNIMAEKLDGGKSERGHKIVSPDGLRLFIAQVSIDNGVHWSDKTVYVIASNEDSARKRIKQVYETDYETTAHITFKHEPRAIVDGIVAESPFKGGLPE